MKPDYFTLGQLLRFFDREDDTIQICYRDGDWEDFDEVNTSRSILLESFEDWYVKCLYIEKSIIYDDKPVLRVELWKGAEQMLHNKEGRPLAYWYAPASYKSTEYCSNCHERTRSEGDDGEKYCINCGAEMIDEQAYRKMRDRGALLMSELDEVIKGLTEAHKANGNLMISLPGGASVLNVLQLIDWLKQVPQEEPKVRGRKGESHDEHMDKTRRAASGEC